MVTIRTSLEGTQTIACIKDGKTSVLKRRDWERAGEGGERVGDGGRTTQLWSAREGSSGEYHLTGMENCRENRRKHEVLRKHV